MLAGDEQAILEPKFSNQLQLRPLICKRLNLAQKPSHLRNMNWYPDVSSVGFFFDASRDSRQLKDQVPTLPHNSFGNAPCMVSLAVNIGELAYGEAMVHHCSETQAAHVVTLFKLVTAEFETSPGQLTFYCQYPSISHQWRIDFGQLFV